MGRPPKDKTIVKELREDNINESFESVMKILVEYLEYHGHRKTPERFSILREIYSINGHFDIEALYNRMKNNKYRVSRATLYNTVDLLVDAKLIIRHQFGNHGAQFEKSIKFKYHDHFINLANGEMIEFYDPRIEEIKTSLEANYNVKVSHYSLTFYGSPNDHS